MTVTINGTTGVSGVAGSASTPALIGSDADSGYYINSANEPNASVNGTAVWSAASTFGFKNRVINGDMRIDQRNAGASVTTATSGAYNLDRWNNNNNSGASRFTVQQNAGSVTPPAGFSNYLGCTSTGAYSIISTDVILIRQIIEANNTADLAWGTANAKSATLSFWVYSSLTGTFGGSIKSAASAYSYPFTYTINSANTWEQKTVSITGPTAGTWNTGTSAGVEINFSLGTGATYSGTAGSWASSDYRSATGAGSVVGTNGATLYITGVQLEKGSTATSFDFRSIGTELVLCQRYYEKTFNQGVAPANGSTSGAFASGVNKVWRVDWNATFTAGTIATPTTFMVIKRAAPTVTTYGNNAGQVYVLNLSAGTATWSAATNQTITDRGFEQYTGTVGSANQWGVVFFAYAADAEL